MVRSRSRAKGKGSAKADTCPGCAANPSSKPISLDAQEQWLACDACEAWYHWTCISPAPADEPDMIETWYCAKCMAADSTLEVALKPGARKSSRPKSAINYSNFHKGLEPDPGRWIAVLESKRILPHPFKRMRGEDLTFAWLTEDPEAMTEPVVIEKPDGLGMKLPSASITPADVARLVGPDTPIEVIDVASQAGLNHWTLGMWAKYYMDTRRDKIRNVLSLEVSDTALGDQFEPPTVVKQMDWLETVWPRSRRKAGDYPKVQKYCLMSVAQCWTDWHVDFAASSVFYHVLKGAKTFFCIRPTAENLRQYEKWSGSHERQEQVWLGDMCDAVYRIDLKAGNTMMIPSGWIHAVYTPVDSIVVGGNFLHSLNIGTQLRLHEIEIATRVPKRYRYPQFVRFLWHVGQHYVAKLTGLPKGTLPSDHPPKLVAPLPDDLTNRVLHGLRPLASFLIEQARRLHKDSDESAERKKSARENVPWDEVPDPRGLASALYEAVAVAVRGRPALPSPTAATTNGNGAAASGSKKRKTPGAGPTFRNFAAAPEKKAKTDHRPEPLAPDAHERTAPSTVTTTERLVRPVVPGVNDEDDDGEPVEAEVRTTTQENRVVRLLRDEQGRLVRETRRVTTTVERVAWPVPVVADEGADEVMLPVGSPEPVPMLEDEAKPDSDTLTSLLSHLAETSDAAQRELVENGHAV